MAKKTSSTQFHLGDRVRVKGGSPARVSVMITNPGEGEPDLCVRYDGGMADVLVHSSDVELLSSEHDVES